MKAYVLLLALWVWAAMGTPVPGIPSDATSPQSEAPTPAASFGFPQIDFGTSDPGVDVEFITVIEAKDPTNAADSGSAPYGAANLEDPSSFESRRRRDGDPDRPFLAATTAKAYKNLIQRLRQQLTSENRFSHNVPVLPPQQNPPTRWIDVVVTTQSRAVRLRLRRDNLYIVGYQAVTRRNLGQWHEFNNENNTNLIDGSHFLGFTGCYTALQTVVGRERNQIGLGQQALVTAINSLATSLNRVARARALIVVSQMISEAVRFTSISNYLVDNYNGDAPLPERLIALENGWGAISGALLRSDVEPTAPFRLRFDNNDMGIGDVATAIAHVGLLLARIAVVEQASRHGRGLTGRGESPSAPARLNYLLGRPLVEIFSLRMGYIDGEKPGDLYGTITATDALSTQVLYQVPRDQYQSVSAGEVVRLTGPDRAISAADVFKIDFRLMDKDAVISPDDEISNGLILGHVFDPFFRYDELKTVDVRGKYGIVTMEYVAISNAVEATIEVILINGDGEKPADVYGTITAKTRYGHRNIFEREASQRIEINPGGKLPLIRPAIALPYYSNLGLEMRLWDHDSLPDVSRDDEIANGHFHLTPRIEYSDRRRVTGKYGEIEVRVTWS